MLKKLELATSIVPERCECGCGCVYVYLYDANNKPMAFFTLHESEFPFAEDCVRICRGQETLGQPGRQCCSNW